MVGVAGRASVMMELMQVQNLDGAPRQSPWSEVLDVQRAEVIRGPVGTRACSL